MIGVDNASAVETAVPEPLIELIVIIGLAMITSRRRVLSGSRSSRDVAHTKTSLKYVGFVGDGRWLTVSNRCLTCEGHAPWTEGQACRATRRTRAEISLAWLGYTTVLARTSLLTQCGKSRQSTGGKPISTYDYLLFPYI